MDYVKVMLLQSYFSNGIIQIARFFFAYEDLLFCWAMVEECWIIQEILKEYEKTFEMIRWR